MWTARSSGMRLNCSDSERRSDDEMPPVDEKAGWDDDTPVVVCGAALGPVAEDGVFAVAVVVVAAAAVVEA